MKAKHKFVGTVHDISRWCLRKRGGGLMNKVIVGCGTAEAVTHRKETGPHPQYLQKRLMSLANGIALDLPSLSKRFFEQRHSVSNHDAVGAIADSCWGSQLSAAIWYGQPVSARVPLAVVQSPVAKFVSGIVQRCSRRVRKSLFIVYRRSYIEPGKLT
jgi:hypothetical protein